MFLVRMVSLDFAIEYVEGSQCWNNCHEKNEEIAVYDTSEGVKFECFKARWRMGSKL